MIEDVEGMWGWRLLGKRRGEYITDEESQACVMVVVL